LTGQEYLTATQWHDHLLGSKTRGTRLLQRLGGRIRNGLFVQDLLDGLGHFGLVIRPYFVNAEFGPHEDAAPLPEHCSVRRLTVADVNEMVRITLRPPTATDLASSVEKYYCLGLFHEGELAAYAWANTRGVPVPDSGGAKLFELTADEAYLFDMYVIPRHRGTRLAGTLAQWMHSQLIGLGRHHFYSLTIAFNRSARRFKARLGAREMELRLYLHLRWGRLSGVDFRLRRWGPNLRTADWMRVDA
jgi:GNAT superfamily N-acetyltransferase